MIPFKSRTTAGVSAWPIVVVAVSFLLVGCASVENESSATEKPPVEQPGDELPTEATGDGLTYEEQRALLDEHADYARPANFGVSKAASIAYIAAVEITVEGPFVMDTGQELVDIPELRLVTVEVQSVEWSADHRWNLGKKEQFAAPVVGEKVQLGVLSDWGVSIGSEVTLAVEPETKMNNPDSNGYVSYVVGAPSDSTLVDASLSSLVKSAASTDAGRKMTRSEVLVELASQASVWVDESNVIEADAPLPPGLLKEAAEALELPDQASDNARESRFQGWLTQNSKERQLPVRFDDLPGLRDDKLGTNLAESQIAVVTSEQNELYAVSYRNVGVLGPFSVDTAVGVGSMLGVVPKSGALDLLGWSADADDVGPDTGEVRFRGSIPPRWDPDTEVLVFFENDGSFTLEAIGNDSFRQLVGERVEAIDPGPRSESEP